VEIDHLDGKDPETDMTFSQITPAQAAGRADLLLVDVREAEERFEVRPADSLHVPLGGVESRLAELPRDRTVAFICRSGGRSSMAARVAAARGLTVANVDGGMLAWTEAGLPVASGPESPKEAR
jgi:rhodanese-related sulfurtransferase